MVDLGVITDWDLKYRQGTCKWGTLGTSERGYQMGTYGLGVLVNWDLGY